MTVSGSGVSTSVINSYSLAKAEPLAASRAASQVCLTSAEVNGVPSDQRTSGFSFQVTVVRSSETPPFSSVGSSAASCGWKLPSGSW